MPLGSIIIHHGAIFQDADHVGIMVNHELRQSLIDLVETQTTHFNGVRGNGLYFLQ